MTPFDQNGWQIFDQDPLILNWAEQVRPIAQTIATDADHQKLWLRHGNTWFVGVNILPNDALGAVGDGPALQGDVVDWITARYGPLDLDAAQISVNYPGYPKQDSTESDANHRFRKTRDAAHVDGLLPVGPNKRRYVREPHAYVLGIPLTQADAKASPMVVWDGSHHIIRRAFADVLHQHAPDTWEDIDLTDTYHAARRECFETCARRVVNVPVGGCYVVHRLALHGVAPWEDGAECDPSGRIIAYFRPHLHGGVRDWLT